MGKPTPDTSPFERELEDRLDSWKEIAAYLKRDVTTVQRWEKREGMPVHRHLHDRMGSVYASRTELHAWARGRNLRAPQQNGNDSTSDETAVQSPGPPGQDGHFGESVEGAQAASAEKAGARLLLDTSQAPNTPVDARGVSTSPALKLRSLLLIACLILTGVIAVRIRNRLLYDSPAHRVTEQRVTSNSPDAPVEHAVVSPDGRYVAYADPTGLYLRVIASGETRRWDVPKGFIAYPSTWFPDGTHLLVMRIEGMPPTPSLWKLSLLGAAPRKLIDNAGPASVSPDGTRIAFATSPPDAGNQLWVMGADGSNPRKIAEASPPEGPTHSGSSIASLAWSPNSRRIACIEHHGAHALAPLTDLSSVWTRDADGRDPQVILKDTLLGPHSAGGRTGAFSLPLMQTPRVNATMRKYIPFAWTNAPEKRPGSHSSSPVVWAASEGSP